MDKLYHLQETLEEKYDIVEQERSSFLMRVETLSFEIKKYRDDLLQMKESIYDHIENTHLDLKKAIADFNNQIERVTLDIDLEKKKLNVQNQDFRKFGLTIETNNRLLDEMQEKIEAMEKSKVDEEKFKQ